MSKYREVETLRDDDGVIAIVTENEENHHLSFSIAKVFERNGQITHTGFLNRRHIAGARRLLDRLDDYFELHKARDRHIARRAASSEG